MTDSENKISIDIRELDPSKTYVAFIKGEGNSAVLENFHLKDRNIWMALFAAPDDFEIEIFEIKKGDVVNVKKAPQWIVENLRRGLPNEVISLEDRLILRSENE